MTFDELITEMDSGSFNSEATGVLRDLLDRLNDHAQRNSKAKGELTVRLSFEALANGRVEIQSDIKSKAPAPPRTRETRWLGERGSLLASDPRQVEMPLKTAGAPARALRTVAPTAPTGGE